MDTGPVSRRAFDRERAARRQAEHLLEEKSRELYEANERLVVANAELEAKIEAATAQIRAALAKAKAASDAKSAFLANVSHEVRTPLTAIIGFADLAIRQAAGNTAVLAHLRTVRRNADHLLALLNDVLDLSKIEAGEMHVEQVELRPHDLVHGVVDLMTPLAEQRGLTLRLAIDDAVPDRIASDPLRVRQILLNLLSNAVKFTEEGGVSVTVGPDAAGTLAFRVSDSGIGIPPDRVDAIFAAFVQVDDTTSRRFGGTGLGLAVSRSLARLMGGDLVVSSTPGQGSVFTLTVPARPCVEAGRPQAEAAEGPALAAGSGRVLAHRRVLIVDDVEDNRLLIEAILAEAGAEVSVAEDGRVGIDTALRAAATGQPIAVILMDTQMPMLDGHEATRELRRAGYTGWIVSLSANTMSGDAERSLAAGCDAVLSKPIDPQALINVCADLAGRARDGRRAA